jgi:transcriptional regulator with XRE-family HTH domain
MAKYKILNTFARYIKNLRTSRGMSQEEISSQMRITLSAYSKIERGLTDPSLSRMKEIAEILKFDLYEIFRCEDKNLFEQLEEDLDSESYRYATKKDLFELTKLVLELQKKIESK